MFWNTIVRSDWRRWECDLSCCVSRKTALLAEPSLAPVKATAPCGLHSIANDAAPPSVQFAGGKVRVGTDKPEIAGDGEGPARMVRISPYRLDTETVTNARFAAFVADTGYVTDAERIGWSPVFRPLLADPERFKPTNESIPWWVPVEGAYWYSPEGEGSNVTDRADHPVVQVSWNDANAFAEWDGGRLPSEAEWELAARGGLQDPRFPWGDDEPDDQAVFCNIWQGDFPHFNSLADGHMATAPARSFQPNGSGLFNMAGNVWEWTADPYRIRSLSSQARARNALATKEQEKVLKGGSFLCHRSYCYRYRIAARSALPLDSSSSNAGFRIARRPV